MSKASTLSRQSSLRVFDGSLNTYDHESKACSCTMRFAVYLPPESVAPDRETSPVPWVLWLSGLTCTEENFMQKAGAQRVAAELGIAIVAPDTSPRGDDVPNDEAYDFGQGAGFYVDATEEPWSKNFQMFSYISEELPDVLRRSDLPLDHQRVAVSGHSMGGHGALMLAARFPERFVSASAFSPICSPTRCPWGEKALGGYLGADRESWKAYDTTLLLQALDDARPMLVDQGTDDQFLEEQLHPHLLREVCATKGHELELNLREGYDHSYYFISTFIENHLRFHARHLQAL